MTSQQDIFVFIDEDQRKKYSKSTLSAINAQVAKYAHKRRQVAPSKPRMARKSPPQLHESDHSEPHAQDAEAKRCSEASITVHVESRHKPAAFVPVNGKQDAKKKLGARDRARQDLSGKVKPGGHSIGSTELVYAKQEDLDKLFERVCRITHIPNYQGFPLHLNPEERQLTHYWFTEIIQDDFGMSRAQFENSFQSCLIKYPLTYQVPLRWMIANSAQRLNQKVGSHSLAVVYRNRQEALARLQGVLTDPDASIDEIVSSLHHTIVHDPESRKLHLRGSDALIEARGGLAKVIEQCTIIQPDHVFLQYTFAPFDIDQYEELETLKTQFLTALLAMQQASVEYVRIRAHSKTCDSNVATVKESTKESAEPMSEWHYVRKRECLFQSDTTVGQLVRRDFDKNASLVVRCRLFAALFHLGAMLQEYGTLEDIFEFFVQLEKSADTLSSVCVDPLTGSRRILPGTFIFMVAHVNRQIGQQKNEMSRAHQKGITAAITGIAAVKLYGLFTDSMRERLHVYLQSWLLGKENACLKDSDISTLSDVITQLWMQQQRSSRSPEQQSTSILGHEYGQDVTLDTQTQIPEAADTVQNIAEKHLHFSNLQELNYNFFPDTDDQAPIVRPAVA